MTMFENYPPRKYEWRIGTNQVTVWQRHKDAEWFADVEAKGFGPVDRSVSVYPKNVLTADAMAQQVIPLVKQLEDIDEQIRPLLNKRESIIEALQQLDKA